MALLVLDDADKAVFDSAAAAYRRGEYEEAINGFRVLAEKGHAGPQVIFGTMYEDGEGVPQDYAEAVKWYRKAAEQGDAVAQFYLGVMYATGQGVAQDDVQAHLWYNLAAAQGNENARKGRDIAAKLMTPAQIAEAQRLAREWKPKKSGEPTLQVRAAIA